MPNYISKVELPDGSPFEIKMPHALTINNHTYDGSKELSAGSTILYVNGTGTDAQTTSPYNYSKWQANISSVESYYNGLTIAYKIPVLGHDIYGTCLQVNNLGYHPVIREGDEPIGSRYRKNSTILLTYQSAATGTICISGTFTSIEGCWIVINDAGPDIPPRNMSMIEFITSTNTTSSGALTGRSSEKFLIPGKVIIYKVEHTLPGTALTLQLFINNGISTEPYPIYIYENIQCKNAYPAGTMLMLVYYNRAFYIVNPFNSVT